MAFLVLVSFGILFLLEGPSEVTKSGFVVGGVLFLIGFKSFKKIEKRHYKPVVISALLGTFIPVYMFALAETEIDSSIASILNSLTPLKNQYKDYQMLRAP